MSQARQDPRDRKIAELEALVADLTARLAGYHNLHANSEHSLVELGLRLSQENEVLRRELAELKNSFRAET